MTAIVYNLNAGAKLIVPGGTNVTVRKGGSNFVVMGPAKDMVLYTGNVTAYSAKIMPKKYLNWATVDTFELVGVTRTSHGSCSPDWFMPTEDLSRDQILWFQVTKTR